MANYINGPKLFQELKLYKEQCDVNEAAGLERPQITDVMSHAIIQICTRMANSHSFVGYSYKSEMIGDAIFKCFRKIHLFDTSRSENVFAYISQIAHNEFIHRIKTEQHQSSVKARLVRNKMSIEFVEHGVDFSSEDDSNSFVDFLLDVDAYVDYHEERKKQSTSSVSGLNRHRNKTPYKRKDGTVSEPKAEKATEFALDGIV